MEYCGLQKFQNEIVKSFPHLFEGKSVSQDSYSVFPGFADVHVHLRQPGFSYKETILTGTKAAAAGGYSHIFSMPNLSPVPDCYENLKPQLDLIKNSAVINVIPYGSITVMQMGEKLSDMEELSQFVGGFSDDGKGVQSEELMLSAMQKAKKLGKIIVAHCEDNSLLNGGYIHDGKYAKLHGHKGICSESEWGPIKRDLELVKKTGCSYHVCHISTKESVQLIREAKAQGLDVTCETAPHYLLIDDSMLQDDGRFKMNPPVRDKSDKEALIEGIIDGTIDMIATDHAPHSQEEKSKGLAGSNMGIVGIETAFPLLYTYFVKKGIISLEKLIEIMSINPKKRFGIPISKNDFCIWNLEQKYIINSNDFLSMGKSTPFEGYEVFGKNILTSANGNIIRR